MATDDNAAWADEEPDWVAELAGSPDDLMPLNPHYHCSTQDNKPCPTGKHINPAPLGDSGSGSP